jgi:hypothetical protein
MVPKKLSLVGQYGAADAVAPNAAHAAMTSEPVKGIVYLLAIACCSVRVYLCSFLNEAAVTNVVAYRL